MRDECDGKYHPLKCVCVCVCVCARARVCARHQVTIFATADEKLLGAECAHSLMTLVERELDLLAGLPADS